MRQVGIGLLAAVLLCGGCGGKREFTGEIPAFERPSKSIARIEGQKFPYCLWYNPDQWMVWDTPFDSGQEVAEWNLALIDPKERLSLGKNTKIGAGASTYTYKDGNLSEKEFKSLIQNRIIDKSNLDAFTDIQSEERLVNGIKVFSWRFTFKPMGEEAVAAWIYFYSDAAGSVAISTYTPENQWDKNGKAIENLLNGFCLLQSRQ